MIKTRAQKGIMNVFVMAIYEVVVMICGLIVPRLILLSFGSTYNGIISSITQFLGFITILRAGVAGASRVSLYKTLAQNDIQATSRVLKATEQYLRKVAYIFLAYLFFMALCYKFISNTVVSWFECFSLVIIIGLGTFAQYYFGLTYQTLLAADQKNYIYYIQQIIVTIINTIVAVILVKTGASIQIVKLGSAIIFVMSPILLNIYVSKKYRIIKNCKPDNGALKQKKDVMGLAVANIVHDNTDIAVLTLFTDVKIVSVYTVYNLVLNGIKKVLSVFTTGLEAAFGNMWAKNEKKVIEKNLRIYELLIYSFISIVFSCTITMILPFVKIYTNGVTDIEYQVPLYAMIAVIAQAFYCVRIPYVTLVQAAGHYKQTRNGSFIEAGINLSVSIALVYKFSIIGVAIGTLIADIFRTIQYAKYCSDHLVNKQYIDIIKHIIWTSLNILVSVIIFQWVQDFINIKSWLTWIIMASCVAIYSSIITFLTSIIFYKEDVIASYQLCKRMMRGNKQTKNNSLI